MGGVVSNDFNERLERVGTRAVYAASNSANQLNHNIASIGNELNYNLANTGSQLNGNVAYLGTRLNDNLAQLGNKAIDAASVSVNQMNHNIANLGSQLNYNLANAGSQFNGNVAYLGTRLNDNLAQLGNKAIDAASVSAYQLTNNVANLGNQLNNNIANAGNQLNNNLDKFGDNVVHEFNTVAVALSSVFDHFKIIIILLAVLQALVILRYTILRSYRFFQKVQMDSWRAVHQNIVHQPTLYPYETRGKLTSKWTAPRHMDIESTGQSGQYADPFQMESWNRQDYKQCLAVARDIPMYENEIVAKPLLNLHYVTV